MPAARAAPAQARLPGADPALAARRDVRLGAGDHHRRRRPTHLVDPAAVLRLLDAHRDGPVDHSPPDLDAAGVPALARDLRRPARSARRSPSRSTRSACSARVPQPADRPALTESRHRCRPRSGGRERACGDLGGGVRRRRTSASRLGRRRSARRWYSWVPTVSSDERGHQRAELRRPLQRQARRPRRPGSRRGTRHRRRSGRPWTFSGNAATVQPAAVAADDLDALRARGWSPGTSTRCSTSASVQPVLDSQQAHLVVVGEQQARARRSATPTSAPSIRASCCDGSAANG